MKNLMKTLIILLVFITATGFKINPEKAINNPKEGRIEVIFNRLLKFNDLVKIKLDLAEKGISLDFKKLEFNENGGLLNISFSVDCNDGFSGNGAKSNLTNQSKYGFYRDYTKGNPASLAFGTGEIK